MSQLNTTVDRMPVHTWSRLPVNTADLILNIPSAKALAGAIHTKAPEDISFTPYPGAQVQNDMGEGYFLSPALNAYLDEHANVRQCIEIPAHYRGADPIVMEMPAPAQHPVLVDDILIEAKEGSQAPVILKYTSEPGQRAEHVGRTRLLVRAGAKLHLIKVQKMAPDALQTDGVEGVVEKNATATVLLAELGAKRCLSSGNVLLSGRAAQVQLDVLYLGEGDRVLDMTYRVEHRGQKTQSNLRMKGILQGRSQKVLRDTLDFIRGASGAKGREEESVLLLSPHIRNISVPLLLCGEDDVEGAHAASVGRLEEKALFYLMSRGIEEREAQKLLAQAALSAIVDTIPDPSLQEEILEAVSHAVAKGGQ